MGSELLKKAKSTELQIAKSLHYNVIHCWVVICQNVIKKSRDLLIKNALCECRLSHSPPHAIRESFAFIEKVQSIL